MYSYWFQMMMPLILDTTVPRWD
ncbi:uncharacterized protein CELE_Y105C5A.1285 [Caenorhabditis elegans]|uniref:Uncharacterized protein n=1 Tax=Caenorhabditis elegans TaxID=6239 RepID=K8ERQ8_CAEEL|nr:Uncharacterized protein CELE_Y105C5A.1285 [Caenorhabditis elegans]CCO25613.1 Uncharacterized protein CELE_Y105C5A.1285 [Caenorhabditis elegans]|eukprot:NP_001263826.1 Uncharacterized protein CELE_Y105C5A.1285 [Caenorhabditis elegans]